MSIKPIIASAFAISLLIPGIASATFQSINECLIDKYCTNPKKPGCHFKWNKQFYFCMKYYDFHGKKFNYDWDYIRTKSDMKHRIKQLNTLISEIQSTKVVSSKDVKLKNKILQSLKNELVKRKQFKIIMKDPNKLP